MTRLDARILVGLLALAVAVGCDNNGGDNTSVPSGTNAPPATATNDTTNVADSEFPDGLHPTAAASSDIASVFAGKLSGTPGAANDANVVVCIGDSITAAGYPANLASMTGKQAVNSGVPGEESIHGASRVSSLLSTYNPGNLCILYGINDLISHRAPADIIQYLSQIAATARAAGSVPVLATLTPVNGKYAKYQSDVDDLNAQIRSFASSQGISLADLAAIF